jgi:hypothetical protein
MDSKFSWGSIMGKGLAAMAVWLALTAAPGASRADDNEAKRWEQVRERQQRADERYWRDLEKSRERQLSDAQRRIDQERAAYRAYDRRWDQQRYQFHDGRYYDDPYYDGRWDRGYAYEPRWESQRREALRPSYGYYDDDRFVNPRYETRRGYYDDYGRYDRGYDPRFDRGYYDPGYYDPAPYDPYRGQRDGVRIGSRIGGAIFGPQGAAIGADIGGAIGSEIDADGRR